MNNIEHEIRKLESLRLYLKIEINSTYGISPNVQPLFDRRNQITQELKKLHKLRSRKIKLKKIKERNEN